MRSFHSRISMSPAVALLALLLVTSNLQPSVLLVQGFSTSVRRQTKTTLRMVGGGPRSSNTRFNAAVTGGDNFQSGPNGDSPTSSTDFLASSPQSSKPVATSPQEQERLRNAYLDWCRQYNKVFDPVRLDIFSSNYLRMEQYAKETGQKVRFNEFADLTTEEYRAMLQQNENTWQRQQRFQQQDSQRQLQLEQYKRTYDQQYAEYQQQLARGETPRRSPPPMPRNELERALAERNPQAYLTYISFSAYLQTAFVGSVVGFLGVLPLTALHYLVWRDYSYTTYAQWEWDMIAATIQGAMFAVVFRYATRKDFVVDDKGVEVNTLANRVLWAFVLVKSLVRISVTPDCASTAWLYCAEPYYLFSEAMVSDLLLNVAESIALFWPISYVMKQLLASNKIRPYDG